MQDEDGDEEDEEGEPGGDMAGGADNPIVLEDDELEAYEEYEEGGHPDHGEEGAAGGEEEQLEGGGLPGLPHTCAAMLHRASHMTAFSVKA